MGLRSIFGLIGLLSLSFNGSEKETIRSLSNYINNHEFLVAYLPLEDELLDLTIEASFQHAKLDMFKIDSLISKNKEFYLIHNHSLVGIDSEKRNINPLYWIAPSEHDIWQYLSIRKKGANLRYGILTQYGLLNLDTDEDTLKYMDNPYFYNSLRDEVDHIQHFLKEIPIDSLEAKVKNYRGMLSLSFEKI